jgi:hypothetical protein
LNPIFITIDSELNLLSTAVLTLIPDGRTISVAHGNWQFPSVSREDLAAQAISISALIKAKGADISDDQVKRLTSFPEKLIFLRAHTVPQIWGSSQVAVPAYLATLQALRAALEDLLPIDLNKEELAAATLALKRVQQRLRALDLTMTEIEPRSVSLAEMVSRIEQAYTAADQLPADLEELAQRRSKMTILLDSANIDASKIADALEKANQTDLKLSVSLETAKTILDRCESAYSASTSIGLAAAFSERSKALAFSMWIWVAGLIGSLMTGGYFGAMRLIEMSELLKSPTIPSGGVALNLLMALFSVGGPIWFAWLSTKQIGQSFKLSEDYAFKTSISRAYEGYRKEAARIDKDLEARLLGSAIDRLDEQPLRLVETTNHGSPWHELFSSELVREAVKSIPGFAESMKEAAKDALTAVAHAKNPRRSASLAPITPVAQE